MKKIFTLFLCLIIVGLASGQSRSKRKHKNLRQKDTITKNQVIKLDNLKAQKDSVDKSKAPLLKSEVVIDTLTVEIGKLSPFKKNAHASYYAEQFHGRKTASGKPFDMNKLTAAHKKLPFGTKVKVTNQANGKSVIVEINDRGPFVKSREIDLSKRAFMQIATHKGAGTMIVTMELLKK